MWLRIRFILKRFTFSRLVQLFLISINSRLEFNGLASLSKTLKIWRHSGLALRSGPLGSYAVYLSHASNDEYLKKDIS